MVSTTQRRVAVGIDVQSIGEVEASLSHFGERYRQRLFTRGELASCGDNQLTPSKLAERFAAKEAVLKILDTRHTVPNWRSIEVTTNSSRGAEIALRDDALDLARSQGISRIFLSLSHAGGLAMATVVADIEPLVGAVYV
jgi:holo-[acyl-carrier protein] synthase